MLKLFLFLIFPFFITINIYNSDIKLTFLEKLKKIILYKKKISNKHEKIIIKKFTFDKEKNHTIYLNNKNKFKKLIDNILYILKNINTKINGFDTEPFSEAINKIK
jgi:hypothetical protein